MIRVLLAIVYALLISQFAAAKPLFGFPKPMTAKEFKVAYAELCLRADALDSLAMHEAATDTLMQRADDVYSRLSELLQDRRSAKADLSKLMDRRVLGGIKSEDGRLYSFSVNALHLGNDYPFFSLLYYVPVKGKPLISSYEEENIALIAVVDADAGTYLTMYPYSCNPECLGFGVDLVQIHAHALTIENVVEGSAPNMLDIKTRFVLHDKELIWMYTDGFQEEGAVPGQTGENKQREIHKLRYRWDGKMFWEVKHERFVIPRK